MKMRVSGCRFQVAGCRLGIALFDVFALQATTYFSASPNGERETGNGERYFRSRRSRSALVVARSIAVHAMANAPSYIA